jgi:hypothetical protein
MDNSKSSKDFMKQALSESTPKEASLSVPTLGVVLSNCPLSIENMAKISGLKPDVINDLLKDEIFTNSIPIRLFEKLVKGTGMPFNVIKDGAFATYQQIINSEKYKKKNKSPYAGLYENEEAMTKYFNRLDELLNNDYVSSEGSAMYETQLVLYRLAKMCEKLELTDSQKEKVEAAHYVIKKYSNIKHCLREQQPASLQFQQPVPQVEIVNQDWPPNIWKIAKGEFEDKYCYSYRNEKELNEHQYPFDTYDQAFDHYVNRFSKPATIPNAVEFAKEVWNMTLSYANNLCIGLSNAYNNDDEIEKATGASACALNIRTEIDDLHPDILAYAQQQATCAKNAQVQTAALPASIIDRLDKIISDYREDIENYKLFQANALKDNNKGAINMWRHKSEGIIRAEKDMVILRELTATCAFFAQVQPDTLPVSIIQDIEWGELKKILSDLANEVNTSGYGGHSTAWGFASFWWKKNKTRYKINTQSIPASIIEQLEKLSPSDSTKEQLYKNGFESCIYKLRELTAAQQEPEFIEEPCTCLCHGGVVMIHAFPCCDKGVVKVNNPKYKPAAHTSGNTPSGDVRVLVNALWLIANMQSSVGVKGATWGDTKFDSESASEGYNQCRYKVISIANKALQQYNLPVEDQHRLWENILDRCIVAHHYDNTERPDDYERTMEDMKNTYHITRINKQP